MLTQTARTVRSEQRVQKGSQNFARKLREGMQAHRLSLQDVAEHTQLTYEHVRKLYHGYALPSKHVLKPLSELLHIRPEELEQLVVADKINRKFGKFPAVIAGKNPELAPLEELWSFLDVRAREDIITFARAMAERIAKAKERK